MLSHVQATFFTPVYSAGRVAGRSSVVVYMAITETPSSLAVFTSQIAPIAFAVFLLTKAITPSHPLMRERHCVFHFSSNGSLTDMLVNSNGLLPSELCLPNKTFFRPFVFDGEADKNAIFRGQFCLPCCEFS
jgi:hypothetical protein